MAKYLFANATGGATFSPAAIEEAEPDCDNCQVLGVGEGDTPREAWENLKKEDAAGPKSILNKGWDDEDLVAYKLFPTKGGSEFVWLSDN